MRGGEKMKKRILIVDDFEYNLEFEKKLLLTFEKDKKVHIEIDTVSTVSEALQYIEKNQSYDIMVIDMNLPDGSGGDIAKAALEKREDTLIAALTLYPEEYQEYLEYFNLFLRKPIMPTDYKKNLSYLLGLERD
jgi:CheY-like chemotaxis protein